MGAKANLGGSGVDRRGLGATTPIFPELTQRRQNAGIKTPTRVELQRDMEFPGPGGQLLRVGTQFEPEPYADVRVKKIDPDCRGRLQAGHGGPEPIWSPDSALMDMVARPQLDQPTSQPVLVRQEAVGVSAVSAVAAFAKWTRTRGISR